MMLLSPLASGDNLEEGEKRAVVQFVEGRLQDNIRRGGIGSADIPSSAEQASLPELHLSVRQFGGLVLTELQVVRLRHQIHGSEQSRVRVPVGHQT